MIDEGSLVVWLPLQICFSPSVERSLMRLLNISKPFEKVFICWILMINPQK